MRYTRRGVGRRASPGGGRLSSPPLPPTSTSSSSSSAVPEMIASFASSSLLRRRTARKYQSSSRLAVVFVGVRFAGLGREPPVVPERLAYVAVRRRRRRTRRTRRSARVDAPGRSVSCLQFGGETTWRRTVVVWNDSDCRSFAEGKNKRRGNAPSLSPPYLIDGYTKTNVAGRRRSRGTVAAGARFLQGACGPGTCRAAIARTRRFLDADEVPLAAFGRRRDLCRYRLKRWLAVRIATATTTGSVEGRWSVPSAVLDTCFE